MRRIILPAAAATVLLAASLALASSGLPKLASAQLGTYTVAIHGDSPGAHTGANTLTVEVAGLDASKAVHLSLQGPNGELVPVRLQPLTDLGGPDAGHDHAAAEPATAAGSEHAGHMPGMDMSHGDAHGSQPAAATVAGRGKVELGATGMWTAVLELHQPDGQSQLTRFTIPVESNGPNPVYLGFTGILMAGSLAYGFVKRFTTQPGIGR